MTKPAIPQVDHVTKNLFSNNLNDKKMKTIQKYFPIITLLFVSTLVLSSCKKDDDTTDDMTADAKSIVQIATENDSFSTLEAALIKANLVSALEADGPFTVFAPTNDAFDMLFEDLGVNGIEDLSAEALTPILLYHVVGANAKSSSLSTGYLPTLNMATPDDMAAKVYVDLNNGVMLNGASKVSTADVEAKNGVIHVIDKVLLPPTVVDIAIANPNFSILVEAVVKAGLVDALMADGPFTVFAPTNEAFEMLFDELNVSGIADLSAEALTPILLYHVVSGNVLSSEVATGMVPTLNEMAKIDMNVSDMGVMLNESTKVIAVDVQGTNGVIHVIDKVLLP